MTAVAERTRTPEKLASRQSPCPLCPDLIEKGDPIKLTTPALGWAHAGCADDYFEVYPQDEETSD
jgi:hypothetical protein